LKEFIDASGKKNALAFVCFVQLASVVHSLQNFQRRLRQFTRHYVE